MAAINPTDYEIMSSIKNRGRNTAANLALELDKDRSYINARFSTLTRLGLVERVGPAPKSGLYEITEKGEQVLLLHRIDQTAAIEALLTNEEDPVV